MFLDIASGDRGGGEPWKPSCRSCKGPISTGEPVERIAFEAGNEHGLDEMNGTYHADCAKPILSAKRAYDMLRNFPF